MSSFQESCSDGNKGLKQNGWTSATPEGVAVSLIPFAASSPHKWSVLATSWSAQSLLIWRICHFIDFILSIKPNTSSRSRWTGGSETSELLRLVEPLSFLLPTLNEVPLPPAQRVMIFHFARVHLYYLYVPVGLV